MVPDSANHSAESAVQAPPTSLTRTVPECAVQSESASSQEVIQVPHNVKADRPEMRNKERRSELRIKI